MSGKQQPTCAVLAALKEYHHKFRRGEKSTPPPPLQWRHLSNGQKEAIEMYLGKHTELSKRYIIIDAVAGFQFAGTEAEDAEYRSELVEASRKGGVHVVARL